MNFQKKCFKTTESYGLEVCGSLCGEKQFLLIFILLTSLFKNRSLKNSKLSSGFAPFKHVKENKLSEYSSARF